MPLSLDSQPHRPPLICKRSQELCQQLSVPHTDILSLWGPDTVAIAVGVLVKISERYVPFGDHFRKALNERLSKNEAQWKDVLALKEIEILSIRSHIVIVDRDVHVPPL